MTALDDRVLDATQQAETPWERLVALYARDPEAFYRLAVEQSPTTSPVRELAALAHAVREAIYATYDIEQQPDGTYLVCPVGRDPLPSIAAGQLDAVRDFLLAADGKTVGQRGGKDYRGTAISEAEMQFKLGPPETWEADKARIEARMAARPMVLRVSHEEIEHLKYQPAYVTHSLLQCARKTLLAPTVAFKGLNRGEDCPTDLKEGWAFCGKPRFAFDNEGSSVPAPKGMVFMVYANTAGYVFDWDWVQESPDEPGYPIDWQLRFDNPHSLNTDAVLELPKQISPGRLDARQVCYSSRGDCLFCYMTDEVASAIRINSDLTVFKSLEGDRYVGFKIKNVRRILQGDQTIKMTDAPGLSVSVASVLLATLKRHPEGSVQVYSVLIQALFKSADEPPQVRVPADAELVDV